jgi:transposase
MAYDRRQLLDKAAFLDFTIEVVKRIEGETSFHLLPRRWVVERSFGWLTPVSSPRPRLRTTPRRFRSHDLCRHGQSARPTYRIEQFSNGL